jgi:hypothetical protein
LYRYIQCCLLSKCFNAAVPILTQQVFEVVPAATGLTSRDFLTYCYYGGMCFAGKGGLDTATFHTTKRNLAVVQNTVQC